MSEQATFQPLLKSKQEEEHTQDNMMLEAFENQPSLPVFMPKKIETFVDEDQTKKVMQQVFIGVGLMIAAMFLAFVFTWAFDKEKTLFIAIYAFIMLLFAALVITLASVSRSSLTNVPLFYVLIGSSAFVSLLNIVLVVVFAVMASKRLKRSYVPSSVQDYINPV